MRAQRARVLPLGVSEQKVVTSATRLPPLSRTIRSGFNAILDIRLGLGTEDLVWRSSEKGAGARTEKTLAQTPLLCAKSRRCTLRNLTSWCLMAGESDLSRGVSPGSTSPASSL